jgi:folate-binding protein YgfZ
VPEQGARVAHRGGGRAPAVRRDGDDVILFERDGAGVVEVTGPEARSFLQSLVSQDLDGLSVGESTRSLLLQPQGKLIATFGLVLAADDRVILYTDEGYGPVLADGLNRFKIRVKADVIDCTDEWTVVAMRQSTAQPDLPGAFRVQANWPNVAGVDLIGPRDVMHDGVRAFLGGGVRRGDFATYERLRIEAGVPRLGVDIDERTIPQEAFLERDAVSFTKGCFLGQELVCRIDTRGHVNRYLRRLDISGAVPVAGAEVVVDDRVVGTVTSVAPTEEGAVALAMIRHEVEPPAEVQLRSANGSTTAIVSSLPG